MQEIEEIQEIEPVRLAIRPLVVDCIPSDSLLVQASAGVEERAFWDALLWREVEKLDRLIVHGVADPNAQQVAESEAGDG